jgi:hypothetical protein
MSRLTVFITGTAVGAALIYAALTHHLLRTSSGWEFVPKTTATFEDSYVDVREFGLVNWADHRELVAALIKADKNQVLGDAARSTLEVNVKGMLDGFRK